MQKMKLPDAQPGCAGVLKAGWMNETDRFNESAADADDLAG
jgi:hypothetical protein